MIRSYQGDEASRPPGGKGRGEGAARKNKITLSRRINQHGGDAAGEAGGVGLEAEAEKYHTKLCVPGRG